MTSLSVYFLNILKLLDCSGNVIFGGLFTLFVKHCVPALGNPHYTCSEAWAEMRDLHEAGQPLWMYRQGCVACKLLTFIQNSIFRIPGDHCTESMQGVPADIESA